MKSKQYLHIEQVDSYNNMKTCYSDCRSVETQKGCIIYIIYTTDGFNIITIEKI
jgi:hypothetical protein